MADMIQTGAADGAIELATMLALADREFNFLSEHFSARPEIKETESGAEFLEALDIARVALTRVRFECSSHEATAGDEHHNLHEAIATMRRREEP